MPSTIGVTVVAVGVMSMRFNVGTLSAPLAEQSVWLQVLMKKMRVRNGEILAAGALESGVHPGAVFAWRLNVPLAVSITYGCVSPAQPLAWILNTPAVAALAAIDVCARRTTTT